MGGRYNNKIWLKATIYSKKNNQITALAIKDPRLTEKHRPTVLIRNIIDIGFERGWYQPDLIKRINVHGLDREYWKIGHLFMPRPAEEDEEVSTNG